MTAIQPARLREQVSHLVTYFPEPENFIQQLHELLNLYARHVFRAGQIGKPAPILPSYKVPEPVLRQIEIELSPYLINDPKQGLTLCDALWEESYYEFNLLAIAILGKIPVENPDEIINRILKWINQVKEYSLQEVIYSRGLNYLSAKKSNEMMNRVPVWLTSSFQSENILGIRVIRTVLENSNFENFPSLFGLLAPLVRSSPSSLRSHIIEILIILAHRSPNETAFFLQQNLGLPSDKDTAWFIRRCLKEFPTDIQTTLSSALRAGKKPIE